MEKTWFELFFVACENMLLPLIVSLATIHITIRHERKKMINEMQRATYMNALKVVHKLTNNPILIFDEKYMDELKITELEIEVYGEKTIKNTFSAFTADMKLKYDEYLGEFGCDECENNSFFEEMFEREKFDYAIEHMPKLYEIAKLAENLKNAIIECIRKG